MKTIRDAKRFFARLFHTRNVIIISPHRTNHLSISGTFQFIGLIAAVAAVGWGSYSTGNYFAARDVLQAKNETLREMAEPRLAKNFNYMAALIPDTGGTPASSSYAMPLPGPSYSLSAVTNDQLLARLALLESKVKELRSANAEIIQTVREKTHDKILSMESIIHQTGLNPGTLQQAAMKRRARASGGDESRADDQGGPFIPLETAEAQDLLGKDIDHKIDQMMALNDVMHVLPLSSPVKNGVEHSGFGRRVDPFNGRLAFHPGLDIAGPPGTLVHATAPGKVVQAGWMGAYGNAVNIDHGLGIVTRYGHMSAVRVHVGEMVKKGQVIGVQGSTGRSTGPHVHYEVRYNDKPLNPIHFLNAGENVSQID